MSDAQSLHRACALVNWLYSRCILSCSLMPCLCCVGQCVWIAGAAAPCLFPVCGDEEPGGEDRRARVPRVTGRVLRRERPGQGAGGAGLDAQGPCGADRGTCTSQWSWRDSGSERVMQCQTLFDHCRVFLSVATPPGTVQHRVECLCSAGQARSGACEYFAVRALAVAAAACHL